MAQITTVQHEGQRYEIPAMWLVGRTSAYRHLRPTAAYAAAVADWVEQGRLEAAFLAQRRAQAA